MSILDEAIKVIERVRDLHLIVKTDKKQRKTIGFTNKIDDVPHFEERLIQLQEQLEDFDASISDNFQNFTLKPVETNLKPAYTPDDENATLIDEELDIKSSNNFDIKPHPSPFKDENLNSTDKNKVLELDFSYSFEDAVNDSSDSLLAEDSLHDKLLFAVNKVGWTPKTRNLALALKRLEDKIGLLDREQKISLGVEWKLILESNLDFIYEQNQSPMRNLSIELRNDEQDYLLPTPKPEIDY